MKERRALAQSERYEVSHQFEVVFLTRLDSLKPDIVIGDFYADPAAAIIDAQERFVIIVGRGLILYKLTEPFEPYRYDAQTNQWIEMFRDAQVWWIETVWQQSENTFAFTANPNSEEGGAYQITFPDMIVRNLSDMDNELLH